MRSMSCHSENIEPVSGILALSTPTPPSPLMSSYLLFLPSPFPPHFAKKIILLTFIFHKASFTNMYY